MKEDSVIKSLLTDGFTGDFSAADGGYAVNGKYNTTPEKQIINATGDVRKDGTQILTFTAYGPAEGRRFNLSDILAGPDVVPSIELLFSAFSDLDEDLKGSENEE